MVTDSNFIVLYLWEARRQIKTY